MSVAGLTALSGAGGVGGLLGTGVSSGSASTGSSFGPAAVLGGSTQDFMQGLYNSMGVLLGAGQTASATPPEGSQAAEERSNTIDAAATLIDLGDTAGGRALAESLLKKNAGDATAQHLLGFSYLAEKDYEQAEKHYAKALALAPDSSRLQSDLANARDLQKSDDEVLALAKRKMASPSYREEGQRLALYLSERAPERADVYLALAEGFEAARKPTQVIGALQEAIDVAGQRDLDEVIAAVTDFAEDYPSIGLPRNMLGRALQKSGRLDQAIQELNSAVKIASDNSAYVQDLGSAYAVRALERIRGGNTTGAGTDLQLARKYYSAAPGLGEVDARMALHRGTRAMALGGHTRALTEFTTAAAKAPDDDAFKRQLAAGFIRLGGHFEGGDTDAQALSSYKQAYELDPSSALAKRKLSEFAYSAGLDALDREDHDKAIEHLTTAYETSRGNDTYRQELARAYDLRGLHWESLGQDDRALADFKAGYKLDPSNSDLNAHLSAAMQ